MNNKTIVVFGGAFNPPTNSHFSLAEQIVSEYKNIDKVMFLPVSDIYNKKDLLPSKLRLDMLKSVVDKNDNFEISLVEVNSQKLLNTVETLEIIQAEYPNHKICFILGTDNLELLPTWEKYEELVTNFKLLVLERDTHNMDEIIDNNVKLKDYENSFIKVEESVRSDCSSTLLREKLRQNKSIRYLVPDEVYNYIHSNKISFNN